MDLGKNLARNIKMLREERHVTQEQLATELNISFQAVSKWENGVSIPDTLMIPEIAQYFGIAIDNLFRDEMTVYHNYASKLFAIYEQSKNQDDFIRADAEYKKIFESGEYTEEDLRTYGLLYEYHMYYCKDKALELYQKVLKTEEKAKSELYYRTKRQKYLLLARIGRADEAIIHERKSIEEEPDNIENYVGLVAACYWGKQYELGYQVFQEAIIKFTKEGANLYAYGGDICKELHKYDEAFKYWDKAIELDHKYIDSMFSIAFCYQEMQQYENEVKAWERIIEWHREQGFTIEVQFPKEMLNKAKDKLRSMGE